MPTITLTVQTEHEITNEGKKNFTLVQLTSGGGDGDNSPPTMSTGSNSAWGSNGGAGGATVSNVPIPNNLIVGNISVSLQQDGNSSITGISGGPIELSPGEAGNTHSNGDDQAEAGRIAGSFPPWVDEETQYAEGAPASSWEPYPGDESGAGLGGGSAGGLDAEPANGNFEQTGGTAPDDFTGDGGNGGNSGQNGVAGHYPGGGGGGAGIGGHSGGQGAGALCIFTYDELDIAITSNGGGPTASVTTHDANVTTVVATEDEDYPGVEYRINGGADAAMFLINVEDIPGKLIFDAGLPSAGDYVVIVEAYQGSTVDSQTITVTVPAPSEGGGGAARYVAMRSKF